MQQAWVICEQCDAVHARLPLAPSARACCTRCGAELYRERRSSVDQLLALTLAGLIVFLIANSYPILTIELGGAGTRTTLLGAILHASQGFLLPLGAIVAICLFLFPLMQLLAGLYVLLPLSRGSRPRYFSAAMHALRLLRPWSMTEVFLLGILVSLVKLAATYTVIPGISLWAFVLLTLILTAIGSIDLHEIWDIGSELPE